MEKMEKNKMEKSNLRIYLLILFVFIIAIIVGFTLGLSQDQKNDTKLQESKEDIAPFSSTQAVELFSVTGILKSVEEGKLIIEPDSISYPDMPKSMEIIISNAKIVKVVPKDKETYDAEYAKYLKDSESDQNAYPPSSVKEVEIQVSDLRVGGMITAFAAQNIKGASSFEAVEVEAKIS